MLLRGGEGEAAPGVSVTGIELNGLLQDGHGLCVFLLANEGVSMGREQAGTIGRGTQKLHIDGVGLVWLALGICVGEHFADGGICGFELVQLFKHADGFRLLAFGIKDESKLGVQGGIVGVAAESGLTSENFFWAIRTWARPAVAADDSGWRWRERR